MEEARDQVGFRWSKGGGGSQGSWSLSRNLRGHRALHTVFLPLFPALRSLLREGTAGRSVRFPLACLFSASYLGRV